MPAFPCGARGDGAALAGRQRRCQESGDWRRWPTMYTEDATYGWNIGPDEEFMAVGRDQIRDIALGLEMGGLDGWTYPYQRVLIDECRARSSACGSRWPTPRGQTAATT